MEFSLAPTLVLQFGTILMKWECWTKCVQALKNPNPLKDDERLIVLAFAELSF